MARARAERERENNGGVGAASKTTTTAKQPPPPAVSPRRRRRFLLLLLLLLLLPRGRRPRAARTPPAAARWASTSHPSSRRRRPRGRRVPRRRPPDERRVLPHTGSHTTAFAWCTPILKDFSRRISPPTTRVQSPPSTPFNSASDAIELHPDVASYGKLPSVVLAKLVGADANVVAGRASRRASRPCASRRGSGRRATRAPPRTRSRRAATTPSSRTFSSRCWTPGEPARARARGRGGRVAVAIPRRAAGGETLTLELAAALSPLLPPLLSSPHARHADASMRFAREIVLAYEPLLKDAATAAAFGGKSGGNARGGIGVDLVGEERAARAGAALRAMRAIARRRGRHRARERRARAEGEGASRVDSTIRGVVTRRDG